MAVCSNMGRRGTLGTGTGPVGGKGGVVMGANKNNNFKRPFRQRADHILGSIVSKCVSHRTTLRRCNIVVGPSELRIGRRRAMGCQAAGEGWANNNNRV